MNINIFYNINIKVIKLEILLNKNVTKSYKDKELFTDNNKINKATS